MEVVGGRGILVRVRNPERYTAVLNGCIYIGDVGEGVHELMVKWSRENVDILTQLGLKNVPSTIKKDYLWPGAFMPMSHQRDTASFIVNNQKCFVFNEAGVGKTASAAWASDYLMDLGLVKRVLVVCPLSIVHAAWRRDLFNVVPHRRVGVAHGSVKTRRGIIAGDYEYVIINFDGVEIILDEIVAGKFDMIIVDEANHLKNVQTRRWRTFKKLIQPETRLVMMTGTPAAQSPEDAYGLAKLVNPTKVPAFFGAWKAAVMQKISMFKWMPKHNAKELVFKVLQPAIRFTKQECLDLPDMMYEVRDVPLTSQQKKYYDKLRKEMLVEAAGEEISAVNAAAKLTKLLQISCIAGDTMVLSELGWKRLDTVAPTDRVWDGVEWVGHGGVVYKGHKPVTTLHGVRMTADHQVLTTEGWHTAQEIVDGEPSKRFIRAAVWIPHSHRTKGDNRGMFNSVCTLVMSVRLWAAGSKKKPVSKGKAPDTPPKLRLPSWERNTQDVVLPAVQCMGRDETTMWFPTRQRLQELRCAGDHGMRRMGELIHSFLGGYAKFVPRWVDVGQDRQQQGVQERQLPMGYGAGAMQQHPEDPPYTDPSRGDDANKCRKVLRDEERNSAREDSSVWVGGGSSIVHTGGEPEAVYDIVDAGPRNRFVVKGSGNSPFIVHNCGSVYSDEGNTVHFDVSSRMNELEAIIDECLHKVIVFAPFTHTIEMIEEFLTRKKHTCAVINGAVSLSKRSAIIEKFQNDPMLRVIIIQPQAAAHGITLTAADTVVWFGPTTSVETFIQANARAHRKGQHNKVTVYMIQGSPAEAKIYASLNKKIDDHEHLIALYNDIINS